MKKLTYKAVAQEHSHGDDGYYAGEGIVFSNSALDAIKKAKSLLMIVSRRTRLKPKIQVLAFSLLSSFSKTVNKSLTSVINYG